MSERIDQIQDWILLVTRKLCRMREEVKALLEHPEHRGKVGGWEACVGAVMLKSKKRFLTNEPMPDAHSVKLHPLCVCVQRVPVCVGCVCMQACVRLCVHTCVSVSVWAVCV